MHQKMLQVELSNILHKELQYITEKINSNNYIMLIGI
jgi:hypothetical protein